MLFLRNEVYADGLAGSLTPSSEEARISLSVFLLAILGILQYSDTLSVSSSWAIAIGIDAYSSYQLRGCVADALLMREYLVQDLDVPKQSLYPLLLRAMHTLPDDPLNPVL